MTGELQPNEWARRDVLEDGFWTTRGDSVRALDGEGNRKTLIAKAVNDTRPPMILEEQISLAAKDDGQTEMLFNRAIEPGARVTVLNTRDGQSFDGTVGMDGQLALALQGLTDGDPLLVSVRDNNNVEGQAIEIVYSSRCKDGKAPSVKGGLGARLPGVI